MKPKDDSLAKAFSCEGHYLLSFLPAFLFPESRCLGFMSNTCLSASPFLPRRFIFFCALFIIVLAFFTICNEEENTKHAHSWNQVCTCILHMICSVDWARSAPLVFSSVPPVSTSVCRNSTSLHVRRQQESYPRQGLCLEGPGTLPGRWECVCSNSLLDKRRNSDSDPWTVLLTYDRQVAMPTWKPTFPDGVGHGAM